MIMDVLTYMLCRSGVLVNVSPCLEMLVGGMWCICTDTVISGLNCLLILHVCLCHVFPSDGENKLCL
jgi:hypothetical protein